MEKTNYFSNILHSDTLSYKFINYENVDKRDLKSTNIIGCTIQNSIFTDISFNSSDFDGTLLIGCKFIRGDWSRSDCCSLTASNTLFSGIDFTLSTMRSCDFKQCTFIECKFDHIALSGSNFEQCNFQDIHLLQSSTYLNTYINCKFDYCNINGNFYYNLLLHNIYTNSLFDKKLFAYNYFLMNNDENIETLKSDDWQKEDLETYLRQNNLLINLVILNLNKANDIDVSIIRFIAAIAEILKIGLVVREEQLQFVYKLLQFLLRNDLISAVTIAETLSCIENIINTFDAQENFAYEKCKETLNIIKNELYQAYQSIGQSITYIPNRSETDIEQNVKIIYEKEPQVPICTIINEIKESLGIDSPDAVRVKTEIGSFHEWITCYDSVLQCMELFIAVLGLGYTVISDHRKKTSKQEDKNIEKKEEIDTISAQMIEMMQKTLNKQKINPEFSQTMQIVVKNEIIASKKFRGYSRSNIQSIDIITKNN